MATTITNSEIPQWKKDLIARLRNQNKKTEERLWNDHHHHRNLVYPSHSSSEENGFNNKELDSSSSSSDSEDLHYGPGIVNRLRNKYLSLALRENNKSRPTILRKATSLENLLDDDDDDDGEIIIGGKNTDEKHDFIKRSNGIGTGNRFRSITRRQEMKRARSVEIISRINHDDDDQNENDELISMTASVTAKINNRQSLHEDIFNNKHNNNEEIENNSRNLNTKNNGTEDIGKFTSRLNRPKRIPQLLNEREKPPVDVVKHAKMIFEKRPESRTKKPPHTGDKNISSHSSKKSKWNYVNKPLKNGDVAAKVDSFNDIIVKTKVALKSTKPVMKTTKPVLNDNKINTLNRFRSSTTTTTTVTKSINEEILKPKTLDLNNKGDNSNKQFNSLPSPIPDVSRVGIKHQDNDSRRNSKSSLCETPDLLLTTNNIPIPNKISSPPNYRQRSTDDFLVEERNRSISSHTEATNIFIYSQIQKDADSTTTAKADPIFQESSTSSSSSQLAVYNFLNAQIDQRHLPINNDGSGEDLSLNYCNKTTTKIGLSAFEIERNLKNAAKDVEDIQQQQQKSEFNEKPSVYKKSIFDLVSNTNNSSEINNVVPAEVNNKQQKHVNNNNNNNSEKLNKGKIINVSSSSEENKIVFAKKPQKSAKIDESSSCSVFNFTSRKDVPDYISNDTSRSPNKWLIPKPDEPGVKLLPDAILSNFKEVQEVLEENELIKCLEARPPSPCDVTFINDNILIDGKSSLIQHSKRLKMKITFVDEAEIYEYPSEISLILDDSSAQLGHTIPQLSGSSLASYTPKTTEDFQLGVTKSFNSSSSSSSQLMNNLKTEEIIPQQQSTENNLLLDEEVDGPILFSSGSTSDILF